MNPSPLAIVIILTISAAVFGGIVFFGLRGSAPLPVPSVPGVTGTVSRIPDILNLPGFGSRQSKPPMPVPPSGTRGADVVVEQSILPEPGIHAPQTPSQSLKDQAPLPVSISPTPPGIGTSRISAGTRTALPESPSGPAIGAAPAVPRQPVPTIPRFSFSPEQQATAVSSFLVFNVSPQLRDLRAQMVKDGVIKETEFVKINNNDDMEKFLLKLVEWPAKNGSSTPEQIQDARDRITKAYDQIRTGTRR